jgi:hypothetical protein
MDRIGFVRPRVFLLSLSLYMISLSLVEAQSRLKGLNEGERLSCRLDSGPTRVLDPPTKKKPRSDLHFLFSSPSFTYSKQYLFIYLF